MKNGLISLKCSYSLVNGGLISWNIPTNMVIAAENNTVCPILAAEQRKKKNQKERNDTYIYLFIVYLLYFRIFYDHDIFWPPIFLSFTCDIKKLCEKSSNNYISWRFVNSGKERKRTKKKEIYRCYLLYVRLYQYICYICPIFTWLLLLTPYFSIFYVRH